MFQFTSRMISFPSPQTELQRSRSLALRIASHITLELCSCSGSRSGQSLGPRRFADASGHST